MLSMVPIWVWASKIGPVYLHLYVNLQHVMGYMGIQKQFLARVSVV
jgi:hypothetical protein